MKRLVAVAMLGLAVAGCSRTGERPDAGGGRPVPIEGDSIHYQTGPCFGACPVYAVTVRPDGSGLFNGIQHTQVKGERAFKLSPEQYRAFEAALAPYRPASGERKFEPGEKGCENAATDMPSVDIRWTRAIGDSQALSYYFGCDMQKNRAMADAIGNAPDLLGIETLIGAVP